ncbi:MAG: C39 family peptidase [Erysipelotrichaceae bacterium]|nr:C39 family peptidase [Erysipelotrichaceae bacterium]
MKKLKILCLLLLSFFIITGFTETTNALVRNTNNLVNEDGTTDEYIYPDNYENPYYSNKVNIDSIVIPLTSKYLTVNQWYQNSGSYIGDYMQTCGSTIDNSGCTLTSFTMVSNYANGTNYSPGQVNSTLGDYACPFNWSGAASTYGTTHSLIARNLNGLSRSSVEEWLVAQLINDNPVIVGLKLSAGTYHYVVVYGYYYDGTDIYFYLKNPTYNGITTLNSYYSAGAVVTRLDIYY